MFTTSLQKHIKPYSVVCALSLLGLARPAIANDEAAQADWYPSRFGAEDRMGAAGTLGPQNALAAGRLIQTGQVYSLAVVTSSETRTSLGRTYAVDAYPLFDEPQGSNKLSGMDDKVTAHMGIGTQIDGFGHVGIDNRHYNGLPASSILEDGALSTYGIHDLPPIVTRGVLLDVAALAGTDRLQGGVRINRAEIDQAMERQKISIQAGDVVLIHTGWLGMMDEDPETFLTISPGLGLEGAEYLVELGVVAVGADTAVLEHMPFADPARPFEVHQTLLPRNGVYILEYVNTAKLAADGAYEFAFVLGAPRFSGAVQAVVNPIAIR